MYDKSVLEKYADVLIWALKNAREFGGGKTEKGDIVRVIYTRSAVSLAEEVYERCLKEGWHTLMRSRGTPRMERLFYENANDEQLTFLEPWAAPKKNRDDIWEENGVTMAENINGHIIIFGPEDLHHLEDIDSKKISKVAVSQRPYRSYLNVKESDGKFGWVLAQWPTEANAKEAGMSFNEYAHEIYKACYLNEDNPVAKWQELYEYSLKISQWLTDMPIDYVHLTSKHCDLTVKIGEKRSWLSVSGHNIPSYECFTSPDFRYTEGTYYADKKSLRDGNIVEGVRLQFKKGKVVKASAKRGEKYLLNQLEMDEGSSYLGEFSLTDRRYSNITKFMASTMYDENVGGKFGNCHVALGASFFSMLHTGDKNKTIPEQKELGYNDSALHWDLVNGEDKKVIAHLKDGSSREIYNHGEFVNVE